MSPSGAVPFFLSCLSKTPSPEWVKIVDALHLKAFSWDIMQLKVFAERMLIMCGRMLMSYIPAIVLQDAAVKH